MTHTSDEPNENANTPSSRDTVEQVAKSEGGAPSEEATSTLSAYFGPAKVSPASFFKALKAAKVRYFTQSDEAQAFELMGNNDPSGDRLWMLISQSKLPEPIDRWIWKASQDRLKAVVGANFDPLDHDAAQILRALVEFSSADLGAKEKDKRRKAENWLRVGICWLIEKRSLDAWQIADQISSTLFKKQNDAKKIALRVLQRGKWGEFRHAVAVAGLARATVERAQQQRDEERRVVSSLRLQLDAGRSKINDLLSQLSALREDVVLASEALAKVKLQLETERQHWGHNLAEAKAGHQAFREQIRRLLSDAIDALEIDPPAPDVALRRLKNVISIIDGATT